MTEGMPFFPRKKKECAVNGNRFVNWRQDSVTNSTDGMHESWLQIRHQAFEKQCVCSPSPNEEAGANAPVAWSN